MTTIKISKGSLRRNGEAIMVDASVASTIKTGDHVEFNYKTYSVSGLGGVFASGSKQNRYVYVKLVEDVSVPKSSLFVVEEKSSKGRKIAIKASGLYCEPISLHLDIKPRSKEVIITTEHAWYKESSGWGGVSKHNITLKYVGDSDPVFLAAKGFLAGDDMALLGVADAIEETGKTDYRHRDVRRFYELASQEKPYEYVRKCKRDNAFANCKFKVGDKVTYNRHYGDSKVYEVVSVYFDEISFEWRVNVPGIGAPQNSFSLVENVE